MQLILNTESKSQSPIRSSIAQATATSFGQSGSMKGGAKEEEENATTDQEDKDTNANLTACAHKESKQSNGGKKRMDHG